MVSKLSELIREKAMGSAEKTILDINMQSDKDPLPIEKEYAPVNGSYYNMRWLERVCIARGWTPTTDKSIIRNQLGYLDTHGGICKLNRKCPCKNMSRDNICETKLFQSAPDRNIKGGTVKTVVVRKEDV
jgi:hypothetical protein